MGSYCGSGSEAAPGQHKLLQPVKEASRLPQKLAAVEAKTSYLGCLSLQDVWFPPLDSRSRPPERQRGCRQAHQTSSILHKDVIDFCLCTC